MTTRTSQETVPLVDDVSIPLIGFGTWQLQGTDAYNGVRAALEIGYRHIDTATGYGNEDQVGAAIRDSGIGRENVFITTKFPPENVGRERETIDESLKVLGVDFVDLWLVHWPPAGEARPETWKAFIEALEQGKTRSIGVSNYSIAQIDELTAATGKTPALNQIPWNPFAYDAHLVDELGSRNVVLEGYSPLKRSDLGNPVLARDRRRARQDARAGDPALARGARVRGDPPLGAPGAHRGELRDLRLRADRRRDQPDRRAEGVGMEIVRYLDAGHGPLAGIQDGLAGPLVGEVDAMLGNRVAGLGEGGCHRGVGDVGVCGDAVRAFAGQQVGGLGEQIVGIAVAAVLGHDSDVADHRVAVVAAGHGEADEVAVGGVGQPPPLARAGHPAQDVQVLPGGGVESGCGDGATGVRVEAVSVDAPQDVEDHGVVGLGTELQAAGPLWHAVLRCPPVAVALD